MGRSRPEQRQEIIHTELHILHLLSTQRRFRKLAFLPLKLYSTISQQQL
jgi:hypothetical protein